MHHPRVVFCLFLAVCEVAAAGSFTPGNVLVTFDDEVREYTTAGSLVQTVAVPDNPGVTESVRDLVLEDDGILHVYNGTFDPLLATLDGVWTDNTLAGWSTVNNVSYGGIAVIAGLIFVTDMATAGDGAPRGIVRFDRTDGFSAIRFSDTVEYIDLTIGLDCVLYALRTDEETLDRFDPLTMGSLGSVTLANDVRAIAVAADGRIFAASWDGNLYHFDSSGAQVDSVASGTNNLTDINLNSTGDLVVGGRFESVRFTTTALDSITGFSLTGFGETFVAHVGGESCIVQDPIFADGFESGDTTLWSSTVP